MKRPGLYHIIYVHILILVCFLPGTPVDAQSVSAGGSVGTNSTSFGKGFGASNQQPSLINKNNMHFSMQVGTSFSASNFGTALTNFVSPAISYQFSKKFTLQVGATIRNSFINYNSGINPFYGEVQPFHGNVTYTTLWASGTYQVNERLILRGTVYRDFSMFSEPGQNNPFYNIDSRGAILDLTFRPSDRVQIGVHMEYHQGYNPYRNPYGFGRNSYGMGGYSPMSPFLPGW